MLSSSSVIVLYMMVLPVWSLCWPATNTTKDIGQFAVLTGGGSCPPDENRTFECVPSEHFESMIWLRTTNDSMTCQHTGDQSGNKGTLHLPCGTYTLQCVYTTDNGRHFSPSINVSTTDVSATQCMESGEDTVTLECPSSRPESGIAVVTWKIGNTTLSSSRGRWLNVSCQASYHGLRVECMEKYQDGRTVKMLVGFLNVSSQSQPNAGVTDDTGTISTESTDTPTSDDDTTEHSDKFNVVVICLAIAIALLLMMFTATLIFFLQKCYRKHKIESRKNNAGRDQGP